MSKKDYTSSYNIESKQSHVAILICTYNGAAYISEQLESFRNQTYKNWDLWVSDDGSSDETISIIQRFGKTLTRNSCHILTGPKKGFFHNFLSVSINEKINSNFYAWSDQDDIWKKDKIQRALEWLETVPNNIPALYSSRTELINEHGLHCGFSPLFKRPPNFKNALVQSIAGGNTMVFNESARTLLKKIDHNLTAPSHDWLMYQLVSGAGGVVKYDPNTSILYRQHSQNIIGSNSSINSKIKRLKMIFEGRFQHWNDQNIEILESSRILNKQNKEILLSYNQARKHGILKRITIMIKLGLYRQTLLGNIGLIIATLIKRL